MFVMEYCNNPKNYVNEDPWIQVETPCGDDDYEKFLDLQKEFDKYIYLASNVRILYSCFLDYISLHEQGESRFWCANKYLLNFVNAFYFLKQYCENYDKSLLKVILDDYYQNKQWYYLMWNYRNYLIHQATDLKDKNIRIEDYLINIDDLMRTVSNDIQVKGGKNKRRYQQILNNIKNDKSILVYDNDHFLPVSIFIKNAYYEITSMNNEILEIIYKNRIIPGLEWLITKSFKVKNEFKYTRIVDIEENEDGTANGEGFESTSVINDFYSLMLNALGDSHPICQKIYDLFIDHGYSCFFDKQHDPCSIDEFSKIYSGLNIYQIY